MTTAKLVTSPGEGHGLTDKLTNPLYQALTKGAKVEPIVALVLLEPVGCGQRKTAQGRHQHVVFDAVALEPILDSARAGELLFQLHALRDARTERAGQRTLPGNWPGMADEEKRQKAIEQIEDWADGNGLAVPSDLTAMWRDYWEIGEGQDRSFGNDGVHGDYRKAGWQQLLDFGYAKEILSRDELLPSEQRDEDDPDADHVATTDAKAACEVCGKTPKNLTDGLCAKCAKSTGTPVPADVAADAG
jgi:hypothetical protein